MNWRHDDGGAVQPSGPPVDPVPLATRAPPPTPRRLSRRVLATFAGVSTIGIAAAIGFALSSTHHHTGDKEQVAIDHPQMADALANAPKDYSAAAFRQAAMMAPPAAPSDTIDSATPAATGTESGNDRAAVLQQRRQQQESARSSKLFATHESARPTPATDIVAATSPPPSGEAGPPATPDAQDRKTAFVTGTGTVQSTINSGRLTQPAGRYVVQAGSTIAAALLTGISSNLPGEVIAQVTEDVFDSVTGSTRLIPQGSRLIGTYDAHVTYGQSRALVVWTRLILPDGRSLDLDRLIGTDAGGQSGFVDRVNHHTGKLLKAGLLSTLFGLGGNLSNGGGNNADIAFAIRDSAGQSIERAGDKLVEHSLDVQPTITIRPGARVRVLVSRDLVLSRWPERKE